MLSDDVLKNVWMSKLPECVRGHVVANTSKKSVSELIEIADLVMDVSTTSSTIAATHSIKTGGGKSSDEIILQLQETVKKLPEAVAKLQHPRGRSNSRNSSLTKATRSTPAIGFATVIIDTSSTTTTDHYHRNQHQSFRQRPIGSTKFIASPNGPNGMHNGTSSAPPIANASPRHRLFG